MPALNDRLHMLRSTRTIRSCPPLAPCPKKLAGYLTVTQDETLPGPAQEIRRALVQLDARVLSYPAHAKAYFQQSTASWKPPPIVNMTNLSERVLKSALLQRLGLEESPDVIASMQSDANRRFLITGVHAMCTASPWPNTGDNPRSHRAFGYAVLPHWIDWRSPIRSNIVVDAFVKRCMTYLNTICAYPEPTTETGQLARYPYMARTTTL
ncbi:hypothetical protein BX600DRAFT_432302 [Xylariales sp. PMI_506]|nr:hypothetical protein BX600DRAFT_432302 [Xylariales sp. PMI_506]